MHVRLVTDVPDKLVLGGVEDVVHGYRELDDAQAGAEVPSRLRDCVNDVSPKLLAQLPELLVVEVLDVHRVIHCVQQRRGGSGLLPGLDVLCAELVPLVSINRAHVSHGALSNPRPKPWVPRS